MFNIRKASSQDYPGIKNILEALDLFYPDVKFDQFWVAEEDGKIVGTVDLQEYKDFIFLASFGIDPSYQKKSYGREFLQKIFAQTTKDIYLYTIIPDFFKKHGFDPCPLPLAPKDLPPKRFECQFCFPEKCTCMVKKSRQPIFPNFKAVKINNREFILSQLKNNPRRICELAFANLIVWWNFDHAHYTFINDNLCILIKPINEDPFFLEPVGNNKIQETVQTCLRHAKKISRASENLISQINIKEYKIKCLRAHFDYIYERKKIAELKGRKFDGKRNHLKKFQKKFPGYQFKKLEKSDQAAAVELFEKWFKEKNPETNPQDDFLKLQYQSQKIAFDLAFNFMEELEIEGGGIFIDNQLKGFILGSQQNQETATLHFQYTDPQIRGINQVLLWEACNHCFLSYKYVNLEQDLGIPGLRKSKMSYHPDKVEKKFEIRCKKQESL